MKIHIHTVASANHMNIVGTDISRSHLIEWYNKSQWGFLRRQMSARVLLQ
ncbi:hypothetical protein ACWJJH_03005 [Endozoicomonadaceae bacterium StTr2]